MLFLDLDGFKEVNDSLGHLAGDQLLVQVADRLRASVRDGDVVARFGGDEFAVLIESATGADDAEAVAQRIVDGLEEPFASESRNIHVQASIGLAAHSGLGDNAGASLLGEVETDGAEQLMRNADLAMYKAKSAGGGSFASYDPQMLAGLVERLELEADLRVALERDELKLHYQPTVDLTTSEIDRLRGAGPLAPPDPRPDLPARLHPDRRGDRPDRPARPLGARGGVPAGRRVEPGRVRPAGQDGGQRLGTPVRPGRPGRRGGRDPGRDRHAGRSSSASR